MKKGIILLLLICVLAVPAGAAEYTAPAAPEDAQELMPVETTTFGRDLWKIVKSAVATLQPEIAESAKACVGLLAAVMAVSMIQVMPGSTVKVVRLAGTLAVAVLLMQQTSSLIDTASETVVELSEYGRLLLPVMAAALASQGGVTSSAALYAGTAVFDALLSAGITAVLIPLIYVFLTLSVAGCATGQSALEKLRGFVKWLTSWFLKTVLYVFTGYISITGVISGTTDASALKATKLTMSGMIPVVGGILSEASEAVLVGAGVMKSAVGVYGLLAIAAIWIAPFLRIGIRYLLLKLTAALCEVFGIKEISNLIAAFSEAMGLLLGMTGAICIILLVSTVCFMKGVG